MSYDDQEYHRRRSEMELEQAVAADDRDSAIAHLELARMHRARREIITKQHISAISRQGGPVCRTDKES